MSINVLIVVSLLAIIMATGAVILSSIAIIKCIAAEKSTHSVHFQPVEEGLKAGLESWGTSDSALKKEAKMYAEDIETNLPEFANTDEDKKVYSF